MTINLHETNIVEILPGDPLFTLNDGIAITDRASFHISEECPPRYRDIILDCLEDGWIYPVARMYDYEVTFTALKK